MTDHSGFRDPSDSLAYGRRRDRAVCCLLRTHPVTVDMLVWLGWFGSRRKAAARLRRLAARGHCALVGTVRPDGGIPQDVYCGLRPNPGQLLHEVELTWLLLRLDASSVRRGPYVLDQAVLPDAEITIRGRLFYLELDRDTMKLLQIMQRFHKYEGCPHLSLWVCPTAERAEALRSRAGRLRSTALFTTYAEALADPHAPIWRDFSGRTAALPREQGSLLRPPMAASRTEEQVTGAELHGAVSPALQ